MLIFGWVSWIVCSCSGINQKKRQAAIKVSDNPIRICCEKACRTDSYGKLLPCFHVSSISFRREAVQHKNCKPSPAITLYLALFRNMNLRRSMYRSAACRPILFLISSDACLAPTVTSCDHPRDLTQSPPIPSRVHIPSRYHHLISAPKSTHQHLIPVSNP